ncbi:MAG: DUF4910 domain-containing protein, partial [Bacteroidales bacterium]
YEERIVGFPEIPMSLITYSNPGDVTAELVWVGSGTTDRDYAGKDVRDKFVLATGYGGSVHRLAVLKYGAKAVVCYLDDDRAKEYPDMLAYTGMWPKTDELERVTFGFNLTNRQGEKLKELLESGAKVVLNGWAKGTGLEPYFMDVVVAHIRGSEKSEEEFLFTAHLDHPKESANDNASGSAALLDICRSMKELIGQGRIDPPKRSIRFLWVPEFYGSMAYVDTHEEVKGKVLDGPFLGSVNMDMVGEHLELLHSNMILTRTPYSLPSVFNDVVANMVEMVDRMNVRTPRGSSSRFNYRITPYSGGSDHAVFNDRKIPSTMIVHSDYTHHTSEDTPDKVDPVEIERAEIIALGSILYLSELTEDQAVDLMYLSGSNAARRLGVSGRKAFNLIRNANENELYDVWSEAYNTVKHSLQWEKECLSSVLNYTHGEILNKNISYFHSQLEEQYDFAIRSLTTAIRERGLTEVPARDLTGKSDSRVPVRLTRGPIGSGIPEEKLTEAEAEWYSTAGRVLNGNVRYEIVNFIDGRRTVSEIRNAVSAEFVPIPLPLVARYIEDLVKSGIADWSY